MCAILLDPLPPPPPLLSLFRLSTITTPLHFIIHIIFSTQSQAGLRFDPIIHFDALQLIFPGLANILSSPGRRLSHSSSRPKVACPTFTQVTPPSFRTPTHTSHYGRLARTYLASINTTPTLIPFNTSHVSHLELHEQIQSHHNGRGTTKAQAGFQGQQQHTAEQVEGTDAQEITHRFVRNVYYHTGQFFLLSSGCRL